MHSIKTKFKPGQMVWLATMHDASVKRAKICCVSVNDYGDKVNIEYASGAYWYGEVPSVSEGLFATKKEAEEFIHQGSSSFVAFKIKQAQEHVQLQEKLLDKAKARLAELFKT